MLDKKQLLSLTAIIFDMNGVIVDDEPIHERIFKEVCRQELGLGITAKEYQEYCQGRTDEEGFKNIVQTYGITSALPRELATKKMNRYFALGNDQIVSVPGAIEFIKKSHRKYCLAIASSSYASEVWLVLQKFGIKDLFDIIVGADDVQHGKPDPEPYLLTAQRLGEKPENCLVIEDSPNGIKSAKAAGMKCAAIATSHPADLLTKADIVARDFAELHQRMLD